MENLKNSWALVTGAGRGIGRSLSLSLARAGVSILAVARTQEDLDALKLEVEKWTVNFSPIVLDLAKPNSAEALFEIILKRNISPRIICLNAAANAAGSFEDIPLEAQENLLYLNALFPLKFIHLMLPLLKENAPSFVVCLSSQGAMIPTPYMATYAASKSFIHNLSLALSYEFHDSGVQFITAIPAPTKSSAFNNMKMPLALQKQLVKERPAEEIAEKIMQALRVPAPLVVTNVSGFPIFKIFVGLAPFSSLLTGAGKMFRILKKKSFYSK